MGKLNGRATPLTNYDMVPDEQRLQVLLDSARNNPDVRRPDGSKSPTLLACEEIFRLKKEYASLQGCNTLAYGRIKQLTTERTNLLRILGDKNDRLWEHDQSRWFRLGRWLGFYR